MFKTFCWYCTTSGIQKQVLQDNFCHIAIFIGKFNREIIQKDGKFDY